jgi:hypothetical protein
MTDGPHSPAVAAALSACNALSQPQRLAVAALIVRDIDDPSCQLQMSCLARNVQATMRDLSRREAEAKEPFDGMATTRGLSRRQAEVHQPFFDATARAELVRIRRDRRIEDIKEVLQIIQAVEELRLTGRDDLPLDRAAQEIALIVFGEE